MDDAMTIEERKRLAAIAAAQAAAAIGVLLQFATSDHEDDTLDINSGGEEVELLLDAAKITAEILMDEREGRPSPADESLNQVHGALVRFLEGWA